MFPMSAIGFQIVFCSGWFDVDSVDELCGQWVLRIFLSRRHWDCSSGRTRHFDLADFKHLDALLD